MSNVFTSCLFSGPSLSISFFQIFSSNIRYVGPYLHLCPELCYVLEDQGGACGYILSTLDSLKFYRDFESVWLPLVTRKYPVMTKVNTEEEVNDNNSNNNWSYDLSFLPIPIPLPSLSLLSMSRSYYKRFILLLYSYRMSCTNAIPHTFTLIS